MRKTILLALFMILSAHLALAQNEPKKAEYFEGISYSNADTRIKGADVVSVNGIPVTGGITGAGTVIGGVPSAGLTVTPNSKRADMIGFDSAMTFYFTPRFGLTGDVSGNFRRDNQTFFGANYRVQTDIYNFLAGPQLRYPNESRWTPFGRVLAGVAYTRNRFSARSATAPIVFFDDSSTDFAMAMGGGVDYRINDKVSYRILQADYNPIFRRGRTITGSDGTIIQLNGKTENNLRFSTGIVLHSKKPPNLRQQKSA